MDVCATCSRHATIQSVFIDRQDGYPRMQKRLSRRKRANMRHFWRTLFVDDLVTRASSAELVYVIHSNLKIRKSTMTTSLPQPFTAFPWLTVCGFSPDKALRCCYLLPILSCLNESTLTRQYLLMSTIAIGQSRLSRIHPYLYGLSICRVNALSSESWAKKTRRSSKDHSLLDEQHAIE